MNGVMAITRRINQATKQGIPRITFTRRINFNLCATSGIGCADARTPIQISRVKIDKVSIIEYLRTQVICGGLPYKINTMGTDGSRKSRAFGCCGGMYICHPHLRLCTKRTTGHVVTVADIGQAIIKVKRFSNFGILAFSSAKLDVGLTKESRRALIT